MYVWVVPSALPAPACAPRPYRLPAPRPPRRWYGMRMDVHLLGGRPIYFPFLSGILTYDCRTCDARCCKGASLGIGRSRELASLLHINPALALLAGEAFPAGSLPVLETVLEQCFFLDSEKLCRLERKAGREHKPAGCRLFPFNQFRAADDWVVVLPHLQCPLRVEPHPMRLSLSSHDALAYEMHLVGVPREGHPALAPPPDHGWARLVPLERQVRDLGAAHLQDADYTAYADKQADVTAHELGTARGVRCSTLRARVATFLGYGDQRPGAGLVRDLVALTPYLRLRVGVAPRPVVPNMLTALSVLAGVVERMPGAVVTCRTVVQLLEKRAPMLVTLAHLLSRPRLSEGYDGDVLVRRAQDLSRELAELLLAVESNGKATHPATFASILQDRPLFRPPLSPEAVGVLMRLGRYLGEAITAD